MANPGTELASLDFGNLIGGPLEAVITAQSQAAEATTKFIKEVGFYEEGTTINDVDVGNTPVYVDFKYPKEIAPYQPGTSYMRVESVEILNGGSGYSTGEVLNFTVAGEGETATVGYKVTAVAVEGDEQPLGAILEVTFDETGTSNSKGSYLNAPTVERVTSATGTGATFSVNATIDSISSSVNAVYQDMTFSVPILTMVPIPFIKVDRMTLDFNAKINSMQTSQQKSSLGIRGSLSLRQGWGSGGVRLNASTSYKKSSSSGSSVERTYSMAVHVEASQDEMPQGMEKLLGILEGAMISKPGTLSE